MSQRRGVEFCRIGSEASSIIDSDIVCCREDCDGRGRLEGGDSVLLVKAEYI